RFVETNKYLYEEKHLHSLRPEGKAPVSASGVKVLLAPVTSSVMLSCDPLLRLNRIENNGEALGRYGKVERFLIPSIQSVADLEDEGRYWCISEGTAGTVVRIRVVYLHSNFRTPSKLVYANVGQSVLLHCEPPDGYPQPQVRWEKVNSLFRTVINFCNNPLIQKPYIQSSLRGDRCDESRVTAFSKFFFWLFMLLCTETLKAVEQSRYLRIKNRRWLPLRRAHLPTG
ncbi:unnamed protein product, partial [Soboliphyme baturini]|uniref:Ig-like domain-containing protein n=1 Tax=Soboliphyme baturini TaxID=241478 RepID=A0A183J2T2_9BILA